MVSLPRFNYSFMPSWPIILIATIFISLFTALGFWQLHRAYEKKMFLYEFNKALQKAPITWDEKSNLPKQYQKLKVCGNFLPITLFLDNQHHQHKFGYDVLLPFMLSDGSIVIVDRGWVQADIRDRKKLPNIQVGEETIKIVGQAYYPAKKHLVLGEVLEKINNKTAIVETQDVAIISNFLQKSVYPFIIREDKIYNSGYVRDWPIVSMPPARHYGYAMQWFLFALVTFIIFIGLNLKKKI